MSLLDEAKAELVRVKAEIDEREAAIRAPLIAKQHTVDSLRAQADELRARINALKLEANDAGVYTPFGDAEAGRVARLLLAGPMFIAAAISLPDHTVQAMVAGLLVAVVAIVWGLSRE